MKAYGENESGERRNSAGSVKYRSGRNINNGSAWLRLYSAGGWLAASGS